MSRVTGGEFTSRRRLRRLKGALFGVIALLATLSGVVVLSLLLGSVVSTALKQAPPRPWYAIGANLASFAGSWLPCSGGPR